MQSKRQLAWELYNTKDSLNSKQMNELINTLPCDQKIKNRISEGVLMSEKYVLDSLEEEIVPLMFIEEVTAGLDIDHNKKYQQGGAYTSKMQNKVVKNFFSKHLKVELSDDTINEIIESEVQYEDSESNDIEMNEYINAAKSEIQYIDQQGGDEEPVDTKSLWLCPECKYKGNKCSNNLCEKCETPNPNPTKSDFDKWKDRYPNIIKLVTKSMNGFLFVFKKIATQIKANSGGKLTEDHMAQLNSLMFQMEPDNILLMIYKRGLQLKDIFYACRDFISDFMIKSFKKIKDLLFWVYDKIIHILNYTGEKIKTFLYPKTYLDNKERVRDIMNKLDIENYPGLYEKKTTLNEIMDIEIEFLERAIDRWINDGPKTIANGTIRGVKDISSSVVETSAMAALTLKNSVLFYFGYAPNKTGLNDEQKIELELRKSQELMIYDYLTKLNSYLESMDFFMYNGPKIGESQKFMMTVYFFNVLYIFKRRWDYGFRPKDIKIFDGTLQKEARQALMESKDDVARYSIGDEIYVTTLEIFMNHFEYNPKENNAVFANAPEYISSYELTYKIPNCHLKGKIIDYGKFKGKNTATLEYYVPLSFLEETVLDPNFISLAEDDKTGRTTDWRPSAMEGYPTLYDVLFKDKGVMKIVGTDEYWNINKNYSKQNTEQYIRELRKKGIIKNINGLPCLIVNEKSTQQKIDSVNAATRRGKNLLLPNKVYKSIMSDNDDFESLLADNLSQNPNSYKKSIGFRRTQYELDQIVRASTDEFTEQQTQCQNDEDAGKIPYPRDGNCPYEEGSPPLKTSNDWLSWIKSEQSKKFVNEDIPKSLFVQEFAMGLDTDEGGAELYPRSCDASVKKYNDSSLNIGDYAMVSNINAHIYLGGNDSSEQEANDYNDALEIALSQCSKSHEPDCFAEQGFYTDSNKKGKITGIFIKDDNGDLKMKTYENFKEETSGWDESKMEENVRFMMDFTMTQEDTLQSGFSEQDLGDIVTYPNGDDIPYVSFHQLVSLGEIQAIDSNFDTTEMRGVIYSYLCGKLEGNSAEALNIEILKTILMLDYDSIKEYDSYQLQTGGGQINEKLYFSLDGNGMIYGISATKGKVASINRNKLFNEMMGGGDKEEKDPENIDNPTINTQLGDKEQKQLEDISSNAEKEPTAMEKAGEKTKQMYKEAILEMQSERSFATWFEKTDFGSKLIHPKSSETYIGKAANALKMVLGRIIQSVFWLAYMFYAGIKFGVSEIAKAAWKLMSANPTLLMLGMKLWEGLLDYVCDELGNLMATVKNSVLDSVGDGYIGGAFAALGIRSDSARKRDVQEKEGKSASISDILDDNISEIQTFWNHYERLHPKTGADKTSLLEDSYNIRADYNVRRNDKRSSSDAPIFIKDLQIDRLVSIPKSRGVVGQMIFGNGDDPIEMLEKSKLSSQPGNIIGGMAGLFKQDFATRFAKLLDVSQFKTIEDELKNYTVNDIYPHLGKIISVVESKVKPGYSFSGENAGSIMVRAKGAFCFLIKEIFKYNDGTKEVGIFNKKYQQDIEDYFESENANIEFITKFTLYDTAIKFINKVAMIPHTKVTDEISKAATDTPQNNAIKIFNPLFLDKIGDYNGFLEVFCGGASFNELGEQITGRVEEGGCSGSPFIAALQEQKALAEQKTGKDILKTRKEIHLESGEEGITRLSEDPLTQTSSISDEVVDTEVYRFKYPGKSDQSEKYISFLVDEADINAESKGKLVDLDTPYVTYKVEVISPSGYNKEPNPHYEYVSLSQIGLVLLTKDGAPVPTIKLARDNNTIPLDVGSLPQLKLTGDNKIDEEYLKTHYYSDKVGKRPKFNNSAKYSSDGSNFNLQMITEGGVYDANQITSVFKVKNSVIKAGIISELKQKLELDKINPLEEVIGRAKSWNEQNGKSERIEENGLIAQAETKLNELKRLQGDVAMETTGISDLIPKMGDIVYVNYPSKYLNKSKMYKSEGLFSSSDKTYNTNPGQATSLYDLLDSTNKMKDTLQKNETSMASDKYYAKQAEERQARLSGISAQDQEFNSTIDEMVAILKDNFNMDSGTFNIDCVANDVCPRFAANPGYFNILLMLQNVVNIVKGGEGFPEELSEKLASGLNPNDAKNAKARFYLYYKKGSNQINSEVFKMFSDFDIISKIPKASLNKGSSYRDREVIVADWKRYAKTISGEQKMDDYEFYRIDGNYCDSRIPTLYEYLSVCNVWNRPGNKGAKEPYPIQMTGYKLDCTYHDKLSQMLIDAQLIASGSARWLAHRAVDAALLFAASSVLLAGGPVTLALGAAVAMPKYTSGAIRYVGEGASSAGRATKEVASSIQASADVNWKDKAAADKDYTERGSYDVTGMIYDSTSSATSAATALSKEALATTTDAIGDVLVFMGDSTQQMAQYIDDGLTYINDTIGAVYTGIHSMLDSMMNTLADFFTGAFAKATGGFSVNQFIINKIIPILVKIYKFTTGKQEKELNIFKSKISNPGGITGGVSNFVMNRVGVGRLVEHATGALLSDSVAKGAGLAARRSLEMPIAALNAVPLASTAGGKGAADIIKSLADDAQAATEKFVKKTIMWNGFIDGIQTAMRIFSNPCHLMLIGLGIKLPAAAYSAIADMMMWLFNKDTVIKEKTGKAAKKLKDQIKTKKEKEIEKARAFLEKDKCESAKKDKLVPNLSILRDLKAEMLEYANQKLQYELNDKANTTDYVEIRNKYRVAEEKYYLLANYMPYNCSMLEIETLKEIAIQYLSGMEFEIPKNNRLILNILYMVQQIGGVIYEFSSSKAGNKLIVTIPEEADQEKKVILIEIPLIKSNELIIEILNNNKFEFDIGYSNYINTELPKMTTEDINNLKNIARSFFSTIIGKEFIIELFSPGPTDKLLKVPMIVSTWMYQLNMLMHKDNHTVDIFKSMDSKPESSWLNSIQSLMGNAYSSLQDKSVEKITYLQKNSNRLYPYIITAANNLKAIYFDYNTEYLITNYEVSAMGDNKDNSIANKIIELGGMLDAVDKLVTIIKDPKKLKLFKDKKVVTQLELSDKKSICEEAHSQYEINEKKLNVLIQTLKNDGLPNDPAKRSLTNLKENYNESVKQLKKMKSDLGNAEDSLKMFSLGSEYSIYFSSKLQIDVVSTDLTTLRGNTYSIITEEMLCQEAVQKRSQVCIFMNRIKESFSQYPIIFKYLLDNLINISPSKSKSLVGKYYNLLRHPVRGHNPVSFIDFIISEYSTFITDVSVKMKKDIEEFDKVVKSSQNDLEKLNNLIKIETQRRDYISAEEQSYDNNIKAIDLMLTTVGTDIEEFDTNSQYHKGAKTMFQKLYTVTKNNVEELQKMIREEINKKCVDKLTVSASLESLKSKLENYLENIASYIDIVKKINVKTKELFDLELITEKESNDKYSPQSLMIFKGDRETLKNLIVSINDKISRLKGEESLKKANADLKEKMSLKVEAFRREMGTEAVTREKGNECPALKISHLAEKGCPPEKDRKKLLKKIHPDKNLKCGNTAAAMTKFITTCPTEAELAATTPIPEDDDDDDEFAGGSLELSNLTKSQIVIKDDIFVFF